MRLPRRVRATVRGPVRTSIRQWQAAHPPPLDRRTIGPPDYVGIGAQRCGTSWWHSLIEQHPRVASLGWGAKELHFFDVAWETDHADPQAYFAHFRRRSGQIAGEWTPRYMWDPWAVPELLRVAPDVKLLVLLRDPVRRFESGIRHAARDVPRLSADDITTAYARGLYAHQLAPVARLIKPENLLVLQFERCVREPEALLKRTFEFLGLDPISANWSGQRNESASPPVAVSAALIASVRERYREDAATLGESFPEDIDLQLWDQLG